MTPLRWGIIGTGKIAQTFVRDLEMIEEADVVAVGRANSPARRRSVMNSMSLVDTAPMRRSLKIPTSTWFTSPPRTRCISRMRRWPSSTASRY